METKFKFLLVEDEPFAQIIARYIIERAGHFFEMVDSAGEALLLLEKNQYDLIFLDLGLPDISGTELIKELRAIRKLKIPIVAVTAFDDESKRLECMQHGFSDFMEKPFSDDKFKATLEKFLIPSSVEIVGLKMGSA